MSEYVTEPIGQNARIVRRASAEEAHGEMEHVIDPAHVIAKDAILADFRKPVCRHCGRRSECEECAAFNDAGLSEWQKALKEVDDE